MRVALVCAPWRGPTAPGSVSRCARWRSARTRPRARPRGARAPQLERALAVGAPPGGPRPHRTTSRKRAPASTRCTGKARPLTRPQGSASRGGGAAVRAAPPARAPGAPASTRPPATAPGRRSSTSSRNGPDSHGCRSAWGKGPRGEPSPNGAQVPPPTPPGDALRTRGAARGARRAPRDAREPGQGAQAARRSSAVVMAAPRRSRTRPGVRWTGAAARGRPSASQASRASRAGSPMGTMRSRRPLPTTWSTPRRRSSRPSGRPTSSETRSPAPYRSSSIARSRRPRGVVAEAAPSSASTSSGESTRGTSLAARRRDPPADRRRLPALDGPAGAASRRARAARRAPSPAGEG